MHGVPTTTNATKTLWCKGFATGWPKWLASHQKIRSLSKLWNMSPANSTGVITITSLTRGIEGEGCWIHAEVVYTIVHLCDNTETILNFSLRLLSNDVDGCVSIGPGLVFWPSLCIYPTSKKVVSCKRICTDLSLHYPTPIIQHTLSAHRIFACIFQVPLHSPSWTLPLSRRREGRCYGHPYWIAFSRRRNRGQITRSRTW